jgi:cytochrome b561
MHDRDLSGYTLQARVLHWLTAVLVVAMIAVGLAITNLDLGAAGDFFFSLHKSTGVLVLLIMVYRLIYRLTHPLPPLPSDMPAIQRFAARSVHAAFYVLLLVQPVIGYIATSAYPAPIPFFWLFELPQLWPENRPLSDQLFAVHRFIGVTLGVLFCAHVGAALFHHFIRKDDVLMRMVRG